MVTQPVIDVETPESICRGYRGDIVVHRWLGCVVDTIALLVPIVVSAVTLGERHPAVAVTLCVVLAFAYFPVTEGLWGRSLGKLVVGLKVVDAAGSRPGVWKALIRTALRLIEINPVLMGGIPAGIAVLATPTHQRLGDLCAHTYVLRNADLRRIGQPVAVPSLPPGAAAWTGAAPYASATPPYLPPAGWGASYAAGPPRPPVPVFKLAAIVGSLVLLAVTFFAGAVAAGLVLAANRDSEQAARFPRPVTITFAEFQQKRPREGWYRVTGGALSVAQSSYTPNDAGKAVPPPIEEAGVPVFDSAEKDFGKTCLVVITHDRGVLRTIEEMRRLQRAGTTDITPWAVAHPEQVLVEREMTGVVRPVADSDVTTSAEVKEVDADLGTDYRVLHEGATPTTRGAGALRSVGIGMFAVLGAVWLAWAGVLVIWGLRERARARAAAQAAPAEGTGP